MCFIEPVITITRYPETVTLCVPREVERHRGYLRRETRRTLNGLRYVGSAGLMSGLISAWRWRNEAAAVAPQPRPAQVGRMPIYMWI